MEVLETDIREKFSELSRGINKWNMPFLKKTNLTRRKDHTTCKPVGIHCDWITGGPLSPSIFGEVFIVRMRKEHKPSRGRVGQSGMEKYNKPLNTSIVNNLWFLTHRQSRLLRNIIQIHNNVSVGLTTFHGIFLIFNLNI